jgi:hypothetical protein
MSTNENISQLIGRIEEVNSQAGITPRLRFSIVVNNKNKTPFELLNLSARVYLQFSERSNQLPTGLGFYISEAVREGSSATIGPGDQNYLNLYVSLPFELVSEIEEARKGLDLSFQLNVVYTMVERTQALELTNRFLTAELADPKVGGNQFLFFSVPKSLWDTLLKQVGYSGELRASRETLLSAVRNARQAEDEATSAARAAKEAASSTAVTMLAQAFDHEATILKATSKRWLWAVLSLACLIIGLLLFYVVESFITRDFTIGQTVVRVTALGILFGGIGLCIRTYNAYQHLELLNRHRVNIGKTFDLFIQSQPSEGAKDVLAAFTAERMINFGGGFPGKEGPESQLSFMTDLVKNLIDGQKTNV